MTVHAPAFGFAGKRRCKGTKHCEQEPDPSHHPFFFFEDMPQWVNDGERTHPSSTLGRHFAAHAAIVQGDNPAIVQGTHNGGSAKAKKQFLGGNPFVLFIFRTSVLFLFLRYCGSHRPCFINLALPTNEVTVNVHTAKLIHEDCHTSTCVDSTQLWADAMALMPHSLALLVKNMI